MILNGVPWCETPVNYVPTLGGKSALFKLQHLPKVLTSEILCPTHLFCNLVFLWLYGAIEHSMILLMVCCTFFIRPCNYNVAIHRMRFLLNFVSHFITLQVFTEVKFLKIMSIRIFAISIIFCNFAHF